MLLVKLHGENQVYHLLACKQVYHLYLHVPIKITAFEGKTAASKNRCLLHQNIAAMSRKLIFQKRTFLFVEVHVIY